jgi:hypothetical protein
MTSSGDIAEQVPGLWVQHQFVNIVANANNVSANGLVSVAFHCAADG